MKEFLIVLGCIIGGIIAIEVFLFSVVIVSSLFVNTKKISNKDNPYYRFLLNMTVTILTFMDRIHVHVTGLEKVPKDQRFLLVCNHRSNFDPIVKMGIFKKYKISFITKPENLKIPFYGKIIQKCCYLPIDRSNPRLAIPTIERAINLLKDGTVSMGVYPEGTRSKTKELLPFHAVVFKIAIKAKVPLVIATIHGAEDIAKAFPFGRSDVYFDVHEVISAEEVVTLRSTELCDRAEKVIRENLEKCEQKDNI